MRTISSLLLPVLALTCMAAATAASSQDAAFVRNALSADAAELTRATVASNSTNALVRQYAGRVSTDHSLSTQQLAAIAGPEGIDTSAAKIPSAISGSSPEPAGGANQTEVKAPAPAPAVYFREEIAAHQRSIALYQKETRSGSDAQLRSFAQHTLPVLEQHLHLARKDLTMVTARPER